VDRPWTCGPRVHLADTELPDRSARICARDGEPVLRPIRLICMKPYPTARRGAVFVMSLVIAGCSESSTRSDTTPSIPRAPVPVSITVALAGTSQTRVEADTTSDPDQECPCVSADPEVVLREFIEAVRNNDTEIIAACQDPQHPLSGSSTLLANSDLLLDKAVRADTPSSSGPPTRVRFTIPLPDSPRPPLPPLETNVIVVLALSLTNTYLIDSVGGITTE